MSLIAATQRLRLFSGRTWRTSARSKGSSVSVASRSPGPVFERSSVSFGKPRAKPTHSPLHGLLTHVPPLSRGSARMVFQLSPSSREEM